MITLTVNYVPSFVRNARQIKMAQIARGADVDSGVVAQVRYAFSAALPLFISAVRTSSRLAQAMEARGFDAGFQRSQYRQLRMERRDWIVLVALAILAMLMVGRVFL
jgi:energy-coupling factor transport system permease protein